MHTLHQPWQKPGPLAADYTHDALRSSAIAPSQSIVLIGDVDVILRTSQRAGKRGACQFRSIVGSAQMGGDDME